MAPLCSEQQGTEWDVGGISGPRITCPPSSPPPPSGAKTMAAGGAPWSWMLRTLIAALILGATGNQDHIGQPCRVGRSCQGLCDPGGPRVTSYDPKVGWMRICICDCVWQWDHLCMWACVCVSVSVWCLFPYHVTICDRWDYPLRLYMWSCDWVRVHLRWCVCLSDCVGGCVWLFGWVYGCRLVSVPASQDCVWQKCLAPWKCVARCLQVAICDCVIVAGCDVMGGYGWLSLWQLQILLSSLTAWRSNRSILREINSETLIRRTDAEAEAKAPEFWSSDAKSQFIGKDTDVGKDWGQEEKGMTGDEMAGWHHWCNGHELGQTSGEGEGQGGLVWCSPWDHKELDMTGQPNYNKAMIKTRVLTTQ